MSIRLPYLSGIEFGVVPGGASARPTAAAAAGKGESLVARLLRGFKNLSQIFAVYDEDDEEEEEPGLGAQRPSVW